MCLSTRNGTNELQELYNYCTYPHANKIVLGIIHQRMLNMRLISEKHIEHNKYMYCCFIDYSKAFDCVDFGLMWRTLLSAGIPKYLVECLKDLYQNQTAEVETIVWRTEPSQFKGASVIMRRALEKWEDGIEISGKYYNNLICADDVALLATTEDNLQQLLNDVGKAS